ncbi:hypothetical protein ACFYKX_01825 [Cytobacillus sp. FJAT-54145]|uniref:Uncharacterized protein n=1 Tax=Cytobacillus spartinae TaxID=3299023 RepID=A0ABW6K6K8_9BACI
MRKIYILLTDTGTLFTKAIKCFTRCPLNHASIAFDETLEDLYSFGRKNERNPFIGGFVRENIHSNLFRNAKCAIYSCSVSDLEYSHIMREIRTIEQNQQNYKYNLIGLFGVMVNKEINRKHAFFCTLFVASILIRSGVNIIEKPACLVKPNDIIQAKQLKLEFEGVLDTYPKVKIRMEKPHTRVGETVRTAFRKVRAYI